MLVHELGTEAPLRRITGGRPAVVEIPYKQGMYAFNLSRDDHPEQSFIIPTALPEALDEPVQVIDIDPAELCLRQLATRLAGRDIALVHGLDQEEYIDNYSQFQSLERQLVRNYHHNARMLTQGLILEDTTVVLPPNSLFYIHQPDMETKVYASNREGIHEVKAT